MAYAFYIAAAVAVVSTFLAIIQWNVVHALLYLIVSFLSVALIFFTLGAPFIAALEIIIYAGAIMVLFVFVVMILNIGPEAARRERRLLEPEAWIAPAVLSAVLLADLLVEAHAGLVAEPLALDHRAQQRRRLRRSQVLLP